MTRHDLPPTWQSNNDERKKFPFCPNNERIEIYGTKQDESAGMASAAGAGGPMQIVAEERATPTSGTATSRVHPHAQAPKRDIEQAHHSANLVHLQHSIAWSTTA